MDKTSANNKRIAKNTLLLYIRMIVIMLVTLYTSRVVLDALGEIAEYCQKLGLEFWFETGQETPVTLLRTIEDIGLPNLGINLDTANIILYGKGNPVDALDVFGKYVRNLHIKDGVYPQNGHKLGHETPIGQGKVDFEKVIIKIHSAIFSLERRFCFSI